jgi:hypothetical protein
MGSGMTGVGGVVVVLMRACIIAQLEGARTEG